MAKERTPHDAALDALIPADRREGYNRTVEMLVARNELLGLLEEVREAEGTTKRELAHRAGLEEASVRRLLTAKTANPTTETAFRIIAALGIKLEAILPGGQRVRIVNPPRRKRESASTKAARKRDVVPV